MDIDNSDNEDAFTIDELEQLEQMRNALLAELNVDEDQIIYEGNEEEGIYDFSNNIEDNTTQNNSNNINIDEVPQQNEPSVDGELMQEEDYDVSNSEEDEFEKEFSENIDNLLEEPIKEGEKTPKHLAKKLKRVLEYRANDHFNVLPDGWVEITHASGIPVYLHKPTRVCTFSRPYFIGRSSIRKHKVPESAITCLYQKKYQDDIEASLKETEQPPSTNVNNDDDMMDRDFRDDSSNNKILSGKLITPGVRVKTELDQRKMQLTADQLYEYAKNRFKFKEICVYRFGKWSEARNFYKRRKMRQLLVGAERTEGENINTNFRTREERPSLPSGIKLITVPSLEIDSKPNKRLFYLNPQGKTSVSILHEFVQKALKCTVRYFFSETRSSATPYHCSVKLVLNNSQATPQYTGRKRFHNRHQQQQPSAEMVRQKLALMHEDFNNINSDYLPTNTTSIESCDKNSADVSSDSEFVVLGEGFGAGKKQAKMIAAKAAVDKLVPGIEFDADGIACNNTSNYENADNTSTSNNLNENSNCSSMVASTSAGSLSNSVGGNTDLHIFDMIGITDTRIPELCARAGQPSPYLVLQEYLKRHSAFGDTAINLTSSWLRHQRHEFKLSIGEEHSVKVVCGNKREGKQIAAQAMLKKLHPELETWGSILKLYGYEAQQKFRDARKNKDSVVKLQGIQDESNIRQFQPNNLILDKLRNEMLKLSGDIIKNCFQQQNEGEEQINTKFRRSNFCSELPVLCEEKLCELSNKFMSERPEIQKCLPSVRF